MRNMAFKFTALVLVFLSWEVAGDFYRDAEITWGNGRGNIVEGGRGLSLSLDKYSGSGFQSKKEYLLGRFDMQLKLVPGNSAGTVTTFYPMRVYCSLWNADDWATQGGRVKTDWSKAPFLALYRNFNIDPAWRTQELDANARNRLRWVQQKHMVYDYCADARRFPRGTSPECKRSRF